MRAEISLMWFIYPESKYSSSHIVQERLHSWPSGCALADSLTLRGVCFPPWCDVRQNIGHMFICNKLVLSANTASPLERTVLLNPHSKFFFSFSFETFLGDTELSGAQ